MKFSCKETNTTNTAAAAATATATTTTSISNSNGSNSNTSYVYILLCEADQCLWSTAEQVCSFSPLTLPQQSVSPLPAVQCKTYFVTETSWLELISTSCLYPKT